MSIGLEFLPRGFLAVGWFDAIAATGANHPQRKLDALQKMVWFDVVLPLWYERNTVMHGRSSRNSAKEDESLNERIAWYVSHKRELLAHHGVFLASVAVDLYTIRRKSRSTKRESRRHLDIARVAHTNGCKLLASKQNFITRFLTPVSWRAPQAAEAAGGQHASSSPPPLPGLGPGRRASHSPNNKSGTGCTWQQQHWRPGVRCESRLIFECRDSKADRSLGHITRTLRFSLYTYASCNCQ